MSPHRRALLAALIGAVAGFAVVTAVVVSQGGWPGLDARASALFYPAPRDGAVHSVANAVTLTAVDWVGAVLLGLLGVVLSLRRRSPVPLVVTSAATVALLLGVHVVKLLFAGAVERASPGVHPAPGYPSGHAATAVVMGGTALVLLGGALSSGRRRLALAGVVAYAGVVGLSRVVLGLHPFSDVVGGWLLGSVVVCATALVLPAPIASGRPDGTLGP